MLPIFCAITFIVAHPGPANHFAEYASLLEEVGIPCQIIADQAVSHKFSELKRTPITVINTAKLDSEELLSNATTKVEKSALIIHDIANEKWRQLQKDLKRVHPAIRQAVYYDNPEPLASPLAKKMLEEAEQVIFASFRVKERGLQDENGATINLSQKEVEAIGFYPMKAAETIKALRDQKSAIRASFFKRHNIEEREQKIFVYLGSASDSYFQRAFPGMLQLMSALPYTSSHLFLLQQHPRAKEEGNFDATLLQTSTQPFVVSDLPSLEALAIADGFFYYQTSMAAEGVFADIPLVAQILGDGDAVTKAGAPLVRSSEELKALFQSDKPTAINKKILEYELGIDPLWKNHFLEITRQVLAENP